MWIENTHPATHPHDLVQTTTQSPGLPPNRPVYSIKVTQLLSTNVDNHVSY